MSWNNPKNSGNGNKKDPWGPQGEGPPDIDEALRNFQNKLRKMFGGGEAGSSGSGPGMSSSSKFGVTLASIIVLVIYLISGIYVVEPAEQAVIKRLGKYERTVGPGPHWLAPLFESKDIINVQEVKTTKHGGQMITKDRSLVKAEIAVQYRIYEPKDYLFNLTMPEKSLEQVADSALRAVVGNSTLDEVITIGRLGISEDIRQQIEDIMKSYEAGIEISDLALQQTDPPDEVKAAFDDAVQAQQDEQRLVNQAEAYANKMVPIAEGQAKRVIAEATAYKEQVVLGAKGKTAKFAKLLPEYKMAPEVTRQRLFLDAMEEVYSNSSKVLIDVDSGNNLVYLPLDKIISRSAQNDATSKTEDDTVTYSLEPRTTNVPPQRRVSGRSGYSDLERLSRSGA